MSTLLYSIENELRREQEDVLDDLDDKIMDALTRPGL